MIKFNELRVGNWVYDTKGREAVLSIDGYRYAVKESNNQLEPIKITNDRLLEFGITEGQWFQENSYMIKKSEIQFEEFGEWDIYTRNASRTKQINITFIKNLHQLQNLMYFLTNEEIVRAKEVL